MNRKSDRERLLADVLAETHPIEFREALLGETLRWVGRRRRTRRIRQSALALAAVVVMGGIAWRFHASGHRTIVPATPACAIVGTDSLRAAERIRTEPLDRSCLITSVDSGDVIRTTASNGEYRAIGDDELLALAAPRPAVLVRMGPYVEKLVFANPNGQKYSPLD